MTGKRRNHEHHRRSCKNHRYDYGNNVCVTCRECSAISYQVFELCVRSVAMNLPINISIHQELMTIRHNRINWDMTDETLDIDIPNSYIEGCVYLGELEDEGLLHAQIESDFVLSTDDNGDISKIVLKNFTITNIEIENQHTDKIFDKEIEKQLKGFIEHQIEEHFYEHEHYKNFQYRPNDRL